MSIAYAAIPMIELLLTYRFELVISVFVVIAIIWIWQTIRFTSRQQRVCERSDYHQLAYDYLVWKLGGNVELADELIQLEREKSGCSLKEAIDRVNKEIANDAQQP